MIEKIPNGIIHISESKADCPHCSRHFEFKEFEDSWNKSDGFIKKKCIGCKRFVGITMDIKGNFIAYELAPTEGGE